MRPVPKGTAAGRTLQNPTLQLSLNIDMLPEIIRRRRLAASEPMGTASRALLQVSTEMLMMAPISILVADAAGAVSQLDFEYFELPPPAEVDLTFFDAADTADASFTVTGVGFAKGCVAVGAAACPGSTVIYYFQMDYLGKAPDVPGHYQLDVNFWQEKSSATPSTTTTYDISGVPFTIEVAQPGTRRLLQVVKHAVPRCIRGWCVTALNVKCCICCYIQHESLWVIRVAVHDPAMVCRYANTHRLTSPAAMRADLSGRGPGRCAGRDCHHHVDQPDRHWRPDQRDPCVKPDYPGARGQQHHAGMSPDFRTLTPGMFASARESCVQCSRGTMVSPHVCSP